MDFHVLGPLRAVINGVEVDVRGAKERTLLSHLVAHAGQVVSTADLIDSLWGDDPPRSAAKSLQTYVLRLRNSLEPDRDGEPRLLVTVGAGYRLGITARETDAGRFAQLATLARQSLDGGRAEAALDASRDALDLWRGPAYVGCEESSFGQAEARRLEELRLVTEETRLEAMLALGQESAVAPELERLVREHPLRERLWEMLVLATYRSGQQGRALEAYDRVRVLLADELGVDPGTGLRELHARVLAQDPGLDAPRRHVDVPSELRRNGTPLVGRDQELESLRRLWERTAAGSSTTVVVRGPAGAGAMALAAALADEVAKDGFPVLLGDQQPPAAGPWLRVVRGARAVEEPAAMLLLLTSPGAAPRENATVLDLAPLGGADVRRLVAAYAEPAAVDTMAAEILSAGPAWPGRVHADAARLAREATTRRLAVAVDVVGESSARLSSARADVSSSIVSLGETADDHHVESGVCPWRGLASYDVEHAPWFSGREHLVAELLSRLAASSLLAIVGTSGSGKSSALRAGMLAALADDVLPGSSAWRQVVMRPGRHPMRELARAAIGSHGADAGELLAHLIRAEGESARTLLVVDQMEEVWTACEDDGERAAFLDTLVELVGDPRSTTSVILAVRADYVARAAEHTELAALMADGTVLVGSPTAAEVARAVIRPAARAGLRLEDGLAETIVSEAGTEPGLLPLLSVALTQVWEQRDGHRLTYAGYVATGGISGAIGTLAEDVWSALSKDEQAAARLLLLRLAGPGEGVGVVRRRVPRAEIEALAQPGLRGAVDRLADARLVSVGDAHVEVAHEALFREWPRLRDWLTDDAAGRAVQRRLALAASDWDTEGRDPTGLWRGTRLQSGLDAASARPDEVTHVEQAFLTAGREAADSEEREVRDRAAATARQNRRLRWLLVGTAVFLVVALVAGLLALRSRASAENSADLARDSAVAADAKRLAADALNEDRPALALLEAVEATKRDQSPETYGALLTLLSRGRDSFTRFRIPERFLRIASSADGSTVYLTDNRFSLHAVDTLTGDQLWQVATPDGASQWGDPVAGPDGRWLAAPVFADGHALAILDPGTGEVVREVTMKDLRRAEPDTSPWVDESLHLRGDDLVVTTESHSFVVDPTSGEVLRSHSVPAHSPVSRDLGDGRIGFSDEPNGTLVLDPWTGVTSRERGAVIGASADGQRVITAATSQVLADTASSLLQVRDARWRPVGKPWRVAGFTRDAVFLPGGREVAVAREEVLEVYDARAGTLVRELPGHSGALLQMTLTGPDDDLVWTAGRDGTAVGHDLSGTRGVLRRLTNEMRANGAATAAGVAVVTNFYDSEPNTVSVVDLETGEDLFGELQPVTSCTCQVGSTAITPDGRLALMTILELSDDFEPVTDRGRVVVVDTGSGEVTRVIETPWEASGLAVTPDGGQVLVNGSHGWGLFDLGTGEAVWTREADDEAEWFPGGPQAGVAGDGSIMALGRGDRLVLVDPDSGEELQSKELPDSVALGRLVFDDDTETLVVGSANGYLSFLDVDSLEAVTPARLVTGSWVFDLQLSPDGRMLAVMGSDGDVTLYDADRWRPYGKPVVDKLGWGFLTFTGDALRVHGELGDDYEIDTDPRVWVQAACRSANTQLTAAESAVILPGEPVRPTCS